MKDSRGFTLVELLAMLVVLGILMGITIPNITGILNKSKENTVIGDANKMIDTAKIKISTHKTGYDKLPQLGDNECGVLSLDYLNSNEDISNGPNDGNYLSFDSYVVYKVESVGASKKYKYFVRLIEQKGNNYYGIESINYSDLNKDGFRPGKIEIGKVHGDEDTKTPPTEEEIGDEVGEILKDDMGNPCTIVFYK